MDLQNLRDLGWASVSGNVSNAICSLWMLSKLFAGISELNTLFHAFPNLVFARIRPRWHLCLSHKRGTKKSHSHTGSVFVCVTSFFLSDTQAHTDTQTHRHADTQTRRHSLSLSLLCLSVCLSVCLSLPHSRSTVFLDNQCKL